MTNSETVWKKSRRKQRDSDAVLLPEEFQSLQLSHKNDTTDDTVVAVASFQSLWQQFCSVDSASKQLTLLKKISAAVPSVRATVPKATWSQPQRALIWLLLNATSTQQIRSITIQALVRPAERCAELEAALRCRLASAATPATLDMLEFLLDNRLGRTVAVQCLQALVVFLCTDIRVQTDVLCELTAPVELATAAARAQRPVRLLNTTLQTVEGGATAPDLDQLRRVRPCLGRLLSLSTLTWDLRHTCGRAYALVCHLIGDTDLRATVIQASFAKASIEEVTEAIPLSSWCLPSQVALMSGLIHVLPSTQLLQPACSAAPPGITLTLILGWLVTKGMLVSDTSLVMGFARAILPALGRIQHACHASAKPLLKTCRSGEESSSVHDSGASSSAEPAASDSEATAAALAVSENGRLDSSSLSVTGQHLSSESQPCAGTVRTSSELCAESPAASKPADTPLSDAAYSPAVTSSTCEDAAHISSEDGAESAAVALLAGAPVSDLDTLLPEVLLEDLLQFIWRLMGDDVQAVRAHGADVLTALVELFSASTDGKFLSSLTAAVVALPTHLARRCRAMRCLLPTLGVTRLLAACPQLPEQLVEVLADPTVANRAADLYCLLVSEHWRTAERATWLHVWVDPLFHSDTLPAVVLTQLTKEITKISPGSVAYVVERIASRRRLPRHLLMVLLTVVQAAHRQGALQSETVGQLWRGTLPMDMLDEALQHNDEEVRIAALSVLVDSQKTSALLDPAELKLLTQFVAANLASQSPKFRQQMLALLKKMLVRLEEGAAALLRQLQAAERRHAAADVRLPLLDRLNTYETALHRLFQLCFDGLYAGANFPRRCTSLQLLRLIEHGFGGSTDRPVMSTASWWTREHLLSMLSCLADTYEDNKRMAMQFLRTKDLTLLGFQESELGELLTTMWQLTRTPRPPEPVTAAFLMQAFVRLPGCTEIQLPEVLPCPGRESLPTEAANSLEKEFQEYVAQVYAAHASDSVGDRTEISLASSAADGPVNLKTNAATPTENSTATDTTAAASDEQSSHPAPVADRQFTDRSSIVEKCAAAAPAGAVGAAGLQTMRRALVWLEDEIRQAEVSLPSAAVEAPMHGTLLCVRYLLGDAEAAGTITSRADWHGVGTKLIDLCLRASAAVLPVVSSSSPEGHLPMEHSAAAEHAQRLGLTLQRAASDRPVVSETVACVQPSGGGRAAGVTAQMLLICSWRTMKEVCLLLGYLVQHMPLVVTAGETDVLTPAMLYRIGHHFISLLLETKHRGAFEQAHLGFSQLCNRLWRSPQRELHTLPAHWLNNALSDVRGEGTATLCPTRRSAGLPYLILALLTSEPSVIGSRYFSLTMSSLLSAAALGGDTAVHSMNVLRALFKDSRLGESVAEYVSQGIQTAITGFGANTCAERNSASLLFSALVVRVFGVQRSRDSLAKKNCMTGRMFFLRYPALYQFLLEELRTPRDPFPVLLLLARLYPAPVEAPESQYKLCAFLEPLRAAASSQVLQVREVAARALCSLLPSGEHAAAVEVMVPQVVGAPVGANVRHGRLMQMACMLEHCVLEISSLSSGDLLRWRPVVDLCLRSLAPALDPAATPCAVTQGAVASVLSHCAKLAGFLSADVPVDQLTAAALRLLTQPQTAYFGLEFARTGAVNLLWIMQQERSIHVNSICGYEAVGRHLNLTIALLDLDGDRTKCVDRFSPVYVAKPVPELCLKEPNSSQTTPERPGAGDFPGDEYSSRADLASSLLDLIAQGRIPAAQFSCVFGLLRRILSDTSKVTDWSQLVCRTIHALGDMSSQQKLEEVNDPNIDAESKNYERYEGEATEQDSEREGGKETKENVKTEDDKEKRNASEQSMKVESDSKRRTQEEIPEQETAPEGGAERRQPEQAAAGSVEAVVVDVVRRLEEARTEFIGLAVVVMNQVQRETSEAASLLDAWCEVVASAGAAESAESLRAVACDAAGAALRWSSGTLTVVQEVHLWKTVMTLLVDDDAAIRDSAFDIVCHVSASAGSAAECDEEMDTEADDDGTSDDEELDRCRLRRAVAVFCRQMAGRALRITIRTLLEWIFTDDDGGQLGLTEDEERVFDKGEMNIFSEEVPLVRACCDWLAELLPQLPEQPLLLGVGELRRLSLVAGLPAAYQLELSDLLRQAARQAHGGLRGLAAGVGALAQRGYTLHCLHVYRRLRLCAVLREYFMDPDVEREWQACVGLLQQQLCYPMLWRDVTES